MEKFIRYVLTALFCLFIYVAGVGVSQAATLDELIQGARKERELTVMLPVSVTPELVKALESAMNKAYGTNINVKYIVTANYVKAVAIAVTEHRTGTTPTFDGTSGYDANVIAMLNAGALESIDNWREL